MFPSKLHTHADEGNLSFQTDGSKYVYGSGTPLERSFIISKGLAQLI